jgi:group I intron endonuclease
MAYKIISGIYIIWSRIKPDRFYIGSAGTIKQRWSNHKQALRNNRHHSSKLQNHFNKYGEDDLVFEVLAVCDKKDLIAQDGIVWIEQCFMWAYKPFFNCTPNAGSPRGVKRSQAFKDAVGNRCRGKSTGRPAWNKGIKGCYSQESIDKRTESVCRFYNTEEGYTRREEISQKLKGRKKIKGHGLHVSQAKIGIKRVPLSLETRRKMSLVRMGKIVKPESKVKQKETFRKNMVKKKLNSIIGSLIIRTHE